MGIFDRWFGQGKKDEEQPFVRFGRYSDAYKTEIQYDAWDESLELFESGNYGDYLEAFFQYLYDPQEKNVKSEREEGVTSFEILQGSKRVIGKADASSIKAEVKVAKADEPHISFMRRLLENNFTLKFSRYALDDQNDIGILFDSSILDASPYKLYYALKELATSADKQDDLLLDEFKTLRPIGSGHIEAIPKEESAIKYGYVISSVQKVISIMDSNEPDVNQYPGGFAYLFLSTLYKLDYLVKPEGHLMEVLERQHRDYFAKDGRSNIEKIRKMNAAFTKLLARSEEEYAREFYNVSSTFGITTPVNHDRVVEFIEGELSNIDWYQENKYSEIALAIPSYIVGYCLFNFAVPTPDRALFHLFYEIMESDYFQKLGFSGRFIDAKGNPLGKPIRQAIREIRHTYHSQYPHFTPETAVLDFNNLVDFSRSYMIMMIDLDLTKAF